jgi:uncharacterized protein with HEPN domain
MLHPGEPMTKDRVRQVITANRAELAALGVRSLALFGSVARGEAREESDVDLLVDFDRPIGLFHFFRVQRRLADMLGRRVDWARRSVPPRDWRVRIEDILAAIERARRYTADLDLASFTADEKTIDAVCYCFGIIGEAARNIPDEIVEKTSDLPWAEMRGMRNVIVHEYFGVTRETLWKTALEDLPAVAERLRALLSWNS